MERGKKGNSPVSTLPPTGKATGRRALLGNGDRGGHKGWESIVKKTEKEKSERSIAIQSTLNCDTKSTSLFNKVDEFV